ncbi:MAG: GNAT family N-acetyltransferase [Pararhodobacter sp.]
MDDHAAPPHCGPISPSARLRSKGPLTSDAVESCRARGIALYYDPVQIGWQRADCLDDIDVFEPEAPARGKVGLSFRAWQPADMPLYHAMLDDPALWRFLPEEQPEPLTEADALALIELSNSAGHHDVRAVLENGQPVGQVRLLFTGGEGEVSYWLGRAHWGRGIARRALHDWTEQCRARHPGLSLFARIRADHKASQRVAQAAGYESKGPDTADPRFHIYRLKPSQ